MYIFQSEGKMIDPNAHVAGLELVWLKFVGSGLHPKF